MVHNALLPLLVENAFYEPQCQNKLARSHSDLVLPLRHKPRRSVQSFSSTITLIENTMLVLFTAVPLAYGPFTGVPYFRLKKKSCLFREPWAGGSYTGRTASDYLAFSIDLQNQRKSSREATTPKWYFIRPWNVFEMIYFRHVLLGQRPLLLFDLLWQYILGLTVLVMTVVQVVELKSERCYGHVS